MRETDHWAKSAITKIHMPSSVYNRIMNCERSRYPKNIFNTFRYVFSLTFDDPPEPGFGFLIAFSEIIEPVEL